jgi:aminoglycoside phosphotransferase (APT) family kinase protein
MPCLEGFFQRDRVAEIYLEESGRELHDLEWYEMFAAQRFAIVSIRTTLRSVAYGDAEQPDDLDDVIMFRNLLEEMVERAEAT